MTSRTQYNAKDVAATAGLRDLFQDLLEDNKWLYRRLMQLQRALLVPQLRGFLVDVPRRDAEYAAGQEQLAQMAVELGEVAREVWGDFDNYLQWAVSPKMKLWTLKGQPTVLRDRLKQKFERSALAGPTGKTAISYSVLRYLFYGHLNIRNYRGINAAGKLTKVKKDCVRLWEDTPPQEKRAWVNSKKYPVDAEALQKFDHPLAAQVATWLLLAKGLSYLQGKLTKDNRYRCVYSVGSTKTFRLSCKSNMFEEGGNLQQIPKDRRSAFIADPGKTLIMGDYKTAESHILSAFIGGPYWDVHQSDEDTHEMVGRLMGIDVDRQTCKMVQHAKNYLQTARGMARNLGMTVKRAEECEEAYFTAFPEIPGVYHEWVKKSVRDGEIVVPAEGDHFKPYRRIVYGDDVKDIAAHPPQSMLALITHTAAIRVVEMETFRPIQLLHHNHDELVVQVPEDRVEEGKKWLAEAMELPVVLNGRTLLLGVERETRKSWGKRG